jgi:hypothetical protein
VGQRTEQKEQDNEAESKLGNRRDKGKTRRGREEEREEEKKVDGGR